MQLTGEIVLTSGNYRHQTCPLIIQPQSKSSDAQTVVSFIIACAAGIGIISIGKLIGRSLQQRNILLTEVQEIPSEDYEEVDVIAMPASTGTEVIISEQENEYQFSVKVHRHSSMPQKPKKSPKDLRRKDMLRRKESPCGLTQSEHQCRKYYAGCVKLSTDGLPKRGQFINFRPEDDTPIIKFSKGISFWCALPRAVFSLS
ncbi:hypothetical protein ACTXT7_015309 [Hymenolepis weldensis]